MNGSADNESSLERVSVVIGQGLPRTGLANPEFAHHRAEECGVGHDNFTVFPLRNQTNTERITQRLDLDVSHARTLSAVIL